MKERSRLGARISPQGAPHLSQQTDADALGEQGSGNIVFDNIRYYLSGGTQPKRTWEDVPDDVKRTFERLGIPEQERKFLAGVEAQFD